MNDGSVAQEPEMVRLVLAFCDRLRRLFELLRVSYAPFRHLLRIKLILDHRAFGGITLGSGARGRIAFPLFVVFCLHVGFALGAVGFAIRDPMTYLTLAMSVTGMVLLFPLLLDGSRLLLEAGDVAVIAPLPVPERSYLMVRVVHLTSYIGVMLAALVLPALLVGAFAWSPSILIPTYAVSSALTGLMVLVGLLAAYLGLLRLVDFDRARDALVYAQVAGLTFLFGGLNSVSLLMERIVDSGLLESRPGLLLLYPPSYSGGLFRLVRGGAGGWDVALGVAAFVVPLGGVMLVGLLTRSGVLPSLEAAARSGARPRSTPGRHGITGSIGKLVARPGLERSGYEFFLAMATGDRGFKMATWPPFAMAVAPLFGLAVLYPGVAGRMLPLGVYLLAIMAPSVVEAARVSRHDEASWRFRWLSAAERARFARGALKATLTRYGVVPTLAFAAFCFALQGKKIIPDLLLGMELAATIAILGALRQTRSLPFSISPRANDPTPAGCLGLIATYVATAVAAGIQLTLGLFAFGTWIGVLAAVPVVGFAVSRFRRTALIVGGPALPAGD